MNLGTIEGDRYIKYVDFNKAVLWKNRQLSITKAVWDRLQNSPVVFLEFRDRNKGNWIFRKRDLQEQGQLKVEGQEYQMYFPIDLRIKETSMQGTLSGY